MKLKQSYYEQGEKASKLLARLIKRAGGGRGGDWKSNKYKQEGFASSDPKEV